MIDFNKLANSYTLVESRELIEVNGTGYVLSHNKTKARILLIENDDTNKVFDIGFRTPNDTSKGIQHIIEHTVLCGSRKFPVKDPFIELAKGSLNTFLNAMTYADKTVYPVASVNDKDFHNLLHVYLDAVFYPNIYDYEEIFKQEGWHYELSDPNDELIINGVVYNEMKGVYSSPDNVVASYINKALFPNSVYGKDSGGDPEVIPTLTREEYLDFHRNYYHPSNSYIYLYGNVNFEEELDFIDNEYLSKFDYLYVPSEVGKELGFDKPVYVSGEYDISDDESEEKNTYLSYNIVLGSGTDVKGTTAMDILDYVLFTAPGAPLKKALIDAGICSDVESLLDSSICQPTFTILARNAEASDEERFISIIDENLKKLSSEGINKRSLLAAINHFEFKNKEAGSGRYPKGLILGLDAYETWLYDDKKALDLFELQPVFDDLREGIDNGFFEDFINRELLQNRHKAFVKVLPRKGINKAKEDALKALLDEKKASMSDQEIEALINETAHLKAYQAEPSSEEDMLKLPLLEISDIGKDAIKIKYEEKYKNDVKMVYNDIFTNGISYINLNFDVTGLDISDMQKLVLLSDIFKYVDTDEHDVSSLASEIDIITGGINFSAGVKNLNALNSYSFTFSAGVKTFDRNIYESIKLLKEILFTSKIDDRKRIRETVAEIKASGKNSLVEGGHITASSRAVSYIFPYAAQREYTEGIEYYKYICRLYDNFDAEIEGLIEDFGRILKAILSKSCLTIHYIGRLEAENVFDSLESLTNELSSDSALLENKNSERISPEVLNEGYRVSSQVQYVATAGNFKDAGLEFTGALNVLQVIFSYDYLWTKVRVLGGAYGSMCSFKRSGEMFFTSYRDPNLGETYDVYREAADYLRSFDAGERDMTKYIIGAIAKLDTPMTPQMEGVFYYSAYENGLTNEDLQRTRDEVLGCTKETIKGLVPYIDILSNSGIICAIGNELKIGQSKELFRNVESLT